jgi:hypothetical protein
MSNTASNAEQVYFEKKARYEELLNAKQVSDEILAMFGMPKYGQSPVQFPGLEQARADMYAALREWGKTTEGIEA